MDDAYLQYMLSRLTDHVTDWPQPSVLWRIIEDQRTPTPTPGECGVGGGGTGGRGIGTGQKSDSQPQNKQESE